MFQHRKDLQQNWIGLLCQLEANIRYFPPPPHDPQIPEVNTADTERLEIIPCRNKEPAEHTSMILG